MADGAQENDRELAQFIYRAVGQHFLGAQVAVATKIVVGVVEFEAELFGGDIEHLDRFADDLGTGAVAANHCHIIRFHRIPFHQHPTFMDGTRDFKLSRSGCNRNFQSP